MTTTDQTERYILVPAADVRPDDVCEWWSDTTHAAEYCAVYNGGDVPGYTGAKFKAGFRPLVDRRLTHASVDTSRRPTAPASSERCSCSHEAGDSACDVHPTCWNCGEPAPRRDAMCGPCASSMKPTPSRPPEPTEAERKGKTICLPTALATREIVDAWDAVFRWNEGDKATSPPFYVEQDIHGRVAVVGIGPKGREISTTRADYEEARSLVLRAKVAASKERCRLSVLVDIDDPEFA